MATNYRQLFAIKNKNRDIIKKLIPTIQDKSGIYILTREENGFKYGYIGQATVSIWTRLAEHLSGYQHIDLSIKKHGWYNSTNLVGYKIEYFYAPKEQLNSLEQEYIKKYANKGYQLRNKTAGSQGQGKFGIAENRPAKGYYDGIKQGTKKVQEEIKNYFTKYLDYSIKQPINKTKERKFNEFKAFLENDSENAN